MTGVTVLSRQRACTVIHPNITIKTFHRVEDGDRELSFYRRFPWACPPLVYTAPGVIVTETNPVAGNNPDQQPAYELFDLLQRLAAKHVHHRDVHPANIVLTEDGPKLIDWETATLDTGPSYDMLGPDMSGIPMPDIHIGCGAQWWNSDDENSILNRWGVDINDLMGT